MAGMPFLRRGHPQDKEHLRLQRENGVLRQERVIMESHTDLH
jgi:hypothetical protein